MCTMEPSIVEKALDLGYEKCGIIRVADVLDYAEKLEERIARTPENTAKLSGLARVANIPQTHPWARSIVVCVERYGQYRVPENVQGLIAKYYLMDGRIDPNTPAHQRSVAFEQYLHALGIRTETERKYGITALRWAAHKAGLGIIRRNNFFYTENGSWVHLEAWLTDAEMEYKHAHGLKPCPPNCNRCIAACPTKSLSEPYLMSRAACVSPLTTWEGDDLTHEPLSPLMGTWVFGCDACQDACPFNAGKWASAQEFPGLAELVEGIDLEQIVRMDYAHLLSAMQPKFWYIQPDRVWKWKVNALNAMRNSYDPKYDSAIDAACDDPHEQVREMAAWVRKSVTKEEGSL